MNLLSIREIIKREVIKTKGNPVRNHNTMKEILTDLNVQTVKRGKIIYYVEKDLYEKLNLDIPE